MKVNPEALLQFCDLCEIILDFDKEGICFHIQNGYVPCLEDLMDLISEHKNEVKAVWLARL